MRAASILFILGWQLSSCVLARHWVDVATYHSFSPLDVAVIQEITEGEPLLMTMSPTLPLPTESPTNSPPSPNPTGHPTISPRPTEEPTREPSGQPTPTPTIAPTPPETPEPTPPPVGEVYEFIPPPENPGKGYFNYDFRPNARYGPGSPVLVRHNSTALKMKYQNNHWEGVSTQEYSYWNEFGPNGFGTWKGILRNRQIEENVCGNVGKQSPIDLRDTGARCYETHQVRSRTGDFRMHSDTNIEKLIEGNKLRLKYARRPCRNFSSSKCREPDPPLADFPRNYAGLVDLLHIDFKVPSEHTIYGERFDGEMQMYYLHPGRRVSPAVSVLMRATEDGFNSELQEVLDYFQIRYDTDKASCAARVRQHRKLMTEVHDLLGQNVTRDFHEHYGDFSTDLDDPNYEKKARKLEDGRWDPHGKLMVPGVYFFAYEGSLTEPPCAEMVNWFVMDTPMLLSFDQLEQIKRIIFTHISPDCRKTSTHYRESVARPLQDSANRPVWRCTADDFDPDPVALTIPPTVDLVATNAPTADFVGDVN